MNLSEYLLHDTVVKITYFLEFLHEYCKKKYETFTKFETRFVVTQIRKT